MVFKKGEVTNPKGRPIGAKGKISRELFAELLATIEKVQSNKDISRGRTLLEHLVVRAFKNDTVGIQILKKLVPEKTEENIRLESVQPIKAEMVSSLYTQAEEMINCSEEKMGELIKKLQDKEIDVAGFKEEMIMPMLKCAREQDEWVENLNQGKEDVKQISEIAEKEEV